MTCGPGNVKSRAQESGLVASVADARGGIDSEL